MKTTTSPIVLWIGFCFVLNPIFAQKPIEGEDFQKQMSELLDICVENAMSYNNYEVRIERKLSFLDSKDEPRSGYDEVAAPIEERTTYAVWIDWKAERCLMIRRLIAENVLEDKIEQDELLVDQFEDKQGVRLNGRFPRLAKSEKTDFRGFIRRIDLPKVEMAPLCQFPASFIDIPFDKAINDAKKSLQGSLKKLNDGTWVRSVGDPSKVITIAHFHPDHLLPVFLATSSNYTPPENQTTEYEQVSGVYRPTRILLQTAQLVSTAADKPQSTKLKFRVGRGEIRFRWKQFNAESLEFPSNEALGKGKVEWIKLLEDESH